MGMERPDAAGAHGVEAAVGAAAGGVGSASLEDLLVGAARALRRTWGAGLEGVGGHDIAPHDVRALRVIGRHGPTRLGVVADHLRIAARSATDVVDRLEERGLVVRRPDPADRRAMLVELTDEGERVRGVADERRRAAAAEFFGGLSADEARDLAALLAKLDPHSGARSHP